MILRILVVGPIMENTYVIGSEDTLDAAIIDPGGDAHRIIAELESLKLNVKYILNTHGHGDHIGAISALKDYTGAQYGIHESDIELIKRDSSWIAQAISDFKPPPNPDFNIVHDDIILIGNTSIRAIETPGHTQGGVCYYIEDSVFTGDTLFKGSIGRFDMPGGNGTQLIQSINSRLLTLPEDTKVYPGHGDSSTIYKEKTTNPFLIGRMI
tara:strand:+ start:192 stop:824 length:633 start_codon:yes stop_codon:yes gene_type:complete